MVSDSEFCSNFLKFCETEDEAFLMIEKALKYRKITDILGKRADQIRALQTPVLRIQGKSLTGNDVLWFTVAFMVPSSEFENFKDIYEILLASSMNFESHFRLETDGFKDALDYIFECYHRSSGKPVC